MDNECNSTIINQVHALQMLFPPLITPDPRYLDHKRRILSRLKIARIMLHESLSDFKQIQNKFKVDVRGKYFGINVLERLDWNNTNIFFRMGKNFHKFPNFPERSNLDNFFRIFLQSKCTKNEKIIEILEYFIPDIQISSAPFDLSPFKLLFQTSKVARTYLQQKMENVSLKNSKMISYLSKDNHVFTQTENIPNWSNVTLHIIKESCKDIFTELMQQNGPATSIFLYYDINCFNKSEKSMVLGKIFHVNESKDFKIKYEENFKILEYSDFAKRFVKNITDEYNQDRSHDAVVLFTKDKVNSVFFSGITDWSNVFYLGIKDVKSKLPTLEKFLNSRGIEIHYFSAEEKKIIEDPIYCCYIYKKTTKTYNIFFALVSGEIKFEEGLCYSSRIVSLARIELYESFEELKNQVTQYSIWIRTFESGQMALMYVVKKIQLYHRDRFFYIKNCDGDPLKMNPSNCDWRGNVEIGEIVFNWWYYYGTEGLSEGIVSEILAKFSIGMPRLSLISKSGFQWKSNLEKFIYRIAKDLGLMKKQKLLSLIENKTGAVFPQDIECSFKDKNVVCQKE